MFTTDFTNDTPNEPMSAPKTTNYELKTKTPDPAAGRTPSGIACSQDIPLLDRAGYHAHIARLDRTTPVYQAAFGFWPCNRKKGIWSTSVEVVKGWRPDALYPHFTVNLYHHDVKGVRALLQFGSCHIYLDNSVSFALLDRVEEGTMRMKYFYKIHNGPVYSWITTSVYKVVSTWPRTVPRPPQVWVKPDYFHAELQDEERMQLLNSHSTFSAEYLSLDPATCTDVASADTGLPFYNPNKVEAQTPQEVAMRVLNKSEAGVVSTNSEAFLEAKQKKLKAEQQKLNAEQRKLKAKQEDEAILDDFMESFAPKISPPKPLPGTTLGSVLPGTTIGPALPPTHQAQEHQLPVLSSPALLAEQGEKRKRDNNDEVETDEPLQTRAKLEKEDDGHIG